MKPKNILTLSVARYGGHDNKTFDYYGLDDQKYVIGELVLVDFRHRQSVGVIRQITNQNNYQKNIKLLPITKKLEYNPMPPHLLQLADWVSDYYQSSQKAIWQTILPSGLPAASRKKPAVVLPPDKNIKKHPLNSEQKKAIATIETSDQRGYLLKGVTGSGKTEVYIELLENNLRAGRSAIVLVPEISLAPQMIERLEAHFSANILVTHSHLTAARRKSIWLQALHATGPIIVIGPRSALFTPLKNIGLIIIDEEHETSYKQESSPRYHARQVAAKIAQLTDAKYILGSATPAITTSWLAAQGRLREVRLASRALGQKLPDITIIDLKNHSDLLTPELKKAIAATLQNRRQVLLFLNQRGSAQAYMCQACGQVVRCPNCETSLTMHGDIARLLCHYCNFKINAPALCPNCKSDEMFFIGSGTKNIETRIRAEFKSARIARLDRDNATLEHLEDTYQQLKNSEIDIIIGTQMIARGLDISGIDLVGVILAESMLNIPDFSASERTFALLTQVAGRAGRGQHPGRAIIQTYSPHHPAIQHACSHDVEAYYEYETGHRQKFNYPPFCYLAKVTYNNKSDLAALQATQIVAESLRQLPGVAVLGPAPAYVRKSAGKYRWHIVLKSYDRRKLVEAVKNLGSSWTVDLDPLNLL